MHTAEEIRPHVEMDHPCGSGTQKLYRFDNGLGASVVRFVIDGSAYGISSNPGSYGADAGLWELAVIRWDGDDWQITYDTPVTDGVIGYLDDARVQDYLRQIRALPAA